MIKYPEETEVDSRDDAAVVACHATWRHLSMVYVPRVVRCPCGLLRTSTCQNHLWLSQLVDCTRQTDAPTPHPHSYSFPCQVKISLRKCSIVGFFKSSHVMSTVQSRDAAVKGVEHMAWGPAGFGFIPTHNASTTPPPLSRASPTAMTFLAPKLALYLPVTVLPNQC